MKWIWIVLGIISLVILVGIFSAMIELFANYSVWGGQ